MEVLTIDYDTITAAINKVGKHPQQDMADLEIEFDFGIPLAVFDKWSFWGVRNVPDDLPPHMSLRHRDPRSMLGRYFSEDDVKLMEKTDDQG